MNPDAGAGPQAGGIVAADGRFRPLTVAPEHLARAIRDEVARGARRILTVGGDGTVATAAGALAGTGVELAILPRGTLNHFARDLGIPVEPGAALALAAEGAGRPIDVGTVNGRLFLNTSSLGVYVDLARLRARLRPRLGYLLSLAVSSAILFAKMPSLRATVRIGGRVREYRTPLVFLGVGERELGLGRFGGRLPAGRRGLHLIVIPGKARRRMLGIAVAAMARGIREMSRTPRLDSELVDECVVEVAGEGIEVALDGDARPIASPLRYRLERDALVVVAPPPR